VLTYRTAVLDLLCQIKGGSAPIDFLQLVYPDTNTQLTPTEQIPVDHTIVLVLGNSPTTLTSTPTIAPLSFGTIIIIVGQSDTSTLTLQSQSILPGSNLKLGATTRTLGEGDVLILMSTLFGWLELSFSNN
jgi:hypothetical protein